jgi:hypothetical protein
MSLRSFLYALDAARIEEGFSFHVETQEAPLPTPSDIRAQNAQSMAALSGIMAGAQGAPRVRRGGR